MGSDLSIKASITESQATGDHKQRDWRANGGLVRLADILAPRGPIPVARSTWWAGVRSGRFPRPVKLGPRITAWRVEDIRALIGDPR
jgi:predicted DNA-binding transcriptional regulator AlpA